MASSNNNNNNNYDYKFPLLAKITLHRLLTMTPTGRIKNGCEICLLSRPVDG